MAKFIKVKARVWKEKEGYIDEPVVDWESLGIPQPKGDDEEDDRYEFSERDIIINLSRVESISPYKDGELTLVTMSSTLAEVIAEPFKEFVKRVVVS